jgi:hypothetical protein
MAYQSWNMLWRSVCNKYTWNLIANEVLSFYCILFRSLDVRPLDSFSAFHGTRRINTEFTRALHLLLSLARPIQSTTPHPTSPRSILILSIHLHKHTKINYDNDHSIFSLKSTTMNNIVLQSLLTQRTAPEHFSAVKDLICYW